MACLEHECTNPACGYYWADNTPSRRCPKCGERAIQIFDEPEYLDEDSYGEADE